MLLFRACIFPPVSFRASVELSLTFGVRSRSAALRNFTPFLMLDHFEVSSMFISAIPEIRGPPSPLLEADSFSFRRPPPALAFLTIPTEA